MVLAVVVAIAVVAAVAVVVVLLDAAEVIHHSTRPSWSAIEITSCQQPRLQVKQCGDEGRGRPHPPDQRGAFAKATR